MQRLWRALLRLFFELLYHQLAWTYDLVAWLVSLGHWKAWGRTTLPHLRGQRILELGHGPGHLLVALERRGLDPVGVDLSPNMGRQARRRLQKAGTTVSLVRARAQALPFCAESFDSVVATFPTGFIIDPRTLREVSRAMGSKGRLVVVLGARFDGADLTAVFLTWLYRVTGQSEPNPDALAPCLDEVGLSWRTVREQVGQTSVRLLVAEKS